jgi:hypothetical protein
LAGIAGWNFFGPAVVARVEEVRPPKGLAPDDQLKDRENHINELEAENRRFRHAQGAPARKPSKPQPARAATDLWDGWR